MTDMDSPIQGTPLEGARVVIVAPWHPWKGQTGLLMKARTDAPFPWVVSLENGFEAAVNDGEVRSV